MLSLQPSERYMYNSVHIVYWIGNLDINDTPKMFWNVHAYMDGCCFSTCQCFLWDNVFVYRGVHSTSNYLQVSCVT